METRERSMFKTIETRTTAVMINTFLSLIERRT